MRLVDFLNVSQIELLADLQARDLHERREGIREKLSLMAVAPEVAELLFLLILQKGAKTIVEFGTSHGYSTIHLAAAAERTGGHVFTVDAMPEKTSWARENLAAAGLLHRVTLTTCDGADFAASLPNGIEFVLVDYALPAFEPAFEMLRHRIAPGGLIFFDGGPLGYWKSDTAHGFMTDLESDPGFMVSIVPMRKEQLIVLKLAS